MSMNDKEYKCICGKTFNNSQACNMHMGRCNVYMQSIGRLDKKISNDYKNAEIGRKSAQKNAELRRQQKINKWISEQHRCEHCGKIMTEKFGSGRFCSVSCANSKKHSAETKRKISEGVKLHVNSNSMNKIVGEAYHKRCVERYEKNPRYCKCCGNALPYSKRFNKTCSDVCLQTIYSESGKRVASIQSESRRSRAEKYFCELCENHFKSVRHNESIFNDWDADIIIDDYKIAILWNGPWHYRTVMKNQKSSLEQIQNRDRLKCSEIIKCGYVPYMIKDVSKFNTEFVEKEFKKLLEIITSGEV